MFMLIKKNTKSTSTLIAFHSGSRRLPCFGQIPTHKSRVRSRTARNKVKRISFPWSSFIPQWIFPFGHVSIHFWHWKQSPEISLDPSDGSSTADGHCLVQALQPRIQFSRFLCRVKSGRIGSSEKTAPIGHRKRQKKRSSKNIPIRIKIRRRIPGRYDARRKFPACSMEKTSHGLVPLAFW